MNKENQQNNPESTDVDCNDCVEEDEVFEDALEDSTEDLDMKIDDNEDTSTKTNDKKEVLNDKKEVLNDKKEVLNDKKEVLNDKKEVLNSKKEALNDEKEVLNEIKANNQIINSNSNDEIAKKLKYNAIKERISKIKVYTIEDGIEKCIQSGFELNNEFFNNEFELVTEFCSINYNKNIFYSLIYGTVYFVKTWMSFEQPEIHKCLDILNQCADYVNSRRKVSSWSDYVKKTNYDSFTDEEVHAEITYGELMILIGATTFIKDQNFSSLFKGAFKFKNGYQSFKYCREIYIHRTKWSSKVAKEEFYSNLLAGSGVFHLSIALAPPKVLSILEFIGFTCDENFALQTLRKSINLDNTIKSNYALIMMLVYYSYTQVTVGHGDYQLDEFVLLVQLFKKRNPTSLFTSYFVAKELQLSGELDKSILKFKEIVDTSKDLKQINNACHFELIFLNAAKQEWLECAKYANLIRTSSLWTPCVFNFIYGCSLYQIKEITGNLKLQEEIDGCFREVPRLRRRLAGKSTPIEKLAMSKCNYYFSHNRKLVLPIHELMFYYNLICTFMRCKTAMNDNLRLIEERLKEYDVNKIGKLGQSNDYCFLLALKASFLRHMQYPSLAIETLEQIFLYSKEIEENHLLPFATMELAFCYMQLGQLDYAKRLFKSCINHSKYTAELILHFRAFNGLRKIKKLMKSQDNAKTVQNNPDEIMLSE